MRKAMPAVSRFAITGRSISFSQFSNVLRAVLVMLIALPGKRVDAGNELVDLGGQFIELALKIARSVAAVCLAVGVARRGSDRLHRLKGWPDDRRRRDADAWPRLRRRMNDSGDLQVAVDRDLSGMADGHVEELPRPAAAGESELLI